MDKGLVVENGVCHKDTVNGGHDVWNCENGSSHSSADHLVVMVHGILGSAADWKFAADEFVRKLPYKVYVHCSERNGAKLTLDGVDVVGQRLAEEVLEVIKLKPELRKISFVAHSVGGLVARYTIGILYRPPDGDRPMDSDSLDNSAQENSRATIAGLEAVNFVTVATPHLGSRGNKQVPFLLGVIPLEKVAGCVIHWIFGRTGKHLFLTDDDEGKPPLLKRMVEDNEYPFISALRAFKRRVAYSNVAYDHIVGWRTSCIRRMSELPKWEDSLNEKYPHIVYEEYCKECEQYEATTEEDQTSDKIEEELVSGLSRLSWEKVDVSFHSSRLRSNAHSVIQVKEHYMQTEGADVIQHMIDHFIV